MTNRIINFVNKIRFIHKKVEIEDKSKFYTLSVYVLLVFVGILNRILPFAENIFNKIRVMLFKKELVIKNNIGIFHATVRDDSFSKSMPFFEHYHQNWLDKAKNKKMFVDIGANIGFYTLLALKCKSFESAITIEPTPETFNRLKKNILANGLEKIVNLHNKAIGQEKAKLMLETNEFHTGGNQIQNEESEKSILVDVVPFTEILNENPQAEIKNIGFIKIDVEGFELEVLKGMEEILQKLAPSTLIFIEIRSVDNNRSEVKKLLNENKFKIIDSRGSNYLYEKQV